jgi:hypothetical protein
MDKLPATSDRPTFLIPEVTEGKDGLPVRTGNLVDSGFDGGSFKLTQTAVAEVGAANKTLKISQNEQGVISATPVDIAIAATQVSGLAAIATSGNVNDLVQTAGDYLIFDCGTATSVI